MSEFHDTSTIPPRKLFKTIKANLLKELLNLSKACSGSSKPGKALLCILPAPIFILTALGLHLPN